MPLIQRLALAVVGVAIGSVTGQLFRSGRLARPYALAWGGVGVLALVFALVPGLVAAVAGWFGTESGVLMTTLVLLALVALGVSGSVILSGGTGRAAELSAEVTRLQAEVETLRDELKEARRPTPEKKPKPPSLRT